MDARARPSRLSVEETAHALEEAHLLYDTYIDGDIPRERIEACKDALLRIVVSLRW